MESLPGAPWLEALLDAVVVVDGEGRILRANRRCESLLGWPPAELVGREVECLRAGPSRRANWTRSNGHGG